MTQVAPTSVASMGTSNTRTTEPSLIDAPPDGIENHDEFSWHIDLDWGLHLINDAGYTAEPQTRGANTAPPLSAPTRLEDVPPVVDRARRRDQEMADKERTIAVAVFSKNGQLAEHFNIAVLSKDWPSFIPRKYQIIVCACGITGDDLEHFQKYDNGLWVNYGPAVIVRKGDNVVLRLFGVKVCPGFETAKRQRSASSASDVQPVGQQSPTKAIQTTQGRAAAPTLTLSSSSMDTDSQPIKEMIDLSMSDDEDDDLYAFILQTSVPEGPELPASTGRILSDAEPNTPGRADGKNAWPFKYAVDQHECFAQVEELLLKQEIKLADAFLKVQSTHWVDGTWYHHYRAWKAIKNGDCWGREALIVAIKAGRTDEGKWARFAPKKG
ncbi:uncharacterized protein ARMOST_08066 [Armillaria ostoyae]|uniref:Uncharacterized protein n=1 Tax=Armillaria ostoyae TaxID=47428 RepID=A0A284R7K5_ARMOS|nr:uncharacterized protein ARMOST_08066 [Armillaria ostoyae]